MGALTLDSAGGPAKEDGEGEESPKCSRARSSPRAEGVPEIASEVGRRWSSTSEADQAEGDDANDHHDQNRGGAAARAGGLRRGSGDRAGLRVSDRQEGADGARRPASAS